MPILVYELESPQVVTLEIDNLNPLLNDTQIEELEKRKYEEMIVIPNMVQSIIQFSRIDIIHREETHHK